ncbi:glycosyltransferase family 4 protein [Dapis sp. BLCC M172]|uniref:glycosyltransferase family 4 protein n=1 Tax=Dapis sp. BLCC M172 TaxID=2975281 RepID=UPI003CE7B96D
MKIAFVSQPLDVVIPPSQNSIGIWTYQVARRLAHSHNVIVYVKKTRSKQKIENDENINYKLIWALPNSILLKLSDKLARFSNPKKPLYTANFYNLEYILQVALDLRKQQCDIIHVQNCPQFIPIIRVFNPQSKILLHMHCEWLTQLDYEMIENHLQKVDLVIGCSEYITDKVRRRFPHFASKCQTVFNGVNLEKFTNELNQKRQKDDEIKKLLCVGRVSQEKGIHILLEAFKKVVEEYPQVHLNIVGPFEELPKSFIVSLSDDNQKVAQLASFYQTDKVTGKPISYLEQLKNKITPEIAEKVNFCGPAAHTKIPKYYQEADIFISSSFSEAFGIPNVEAMASKLPVIGTLVGGIPEIIVNEKTGLLIESGDYLALAAAILRLIKDDNLREEMGENGYERAIQLFSWKSITETLVKQYKDILEG